MTSRADTLLDRVGARAREEAQAEARTTMAMLEFADARRAEYEAVGHSADRDLELASIAHELAVELQLSVRSVQNRLHAARMVRGRAPSAWSAFMAGQIDGYRVRIISEALGNLRDPRSDGIVDERVADYATTHTAAELRAWLKRLIARLEPEHNEQRSREAVNDRRVHIDHRDDGVSELWALLPTSQAATIDTMLGEALLSKPSDDTRTSDQYMADELSRRLLARADDEPAVRATIALTIPATSLAGLTDEPGTSLDAAGGHCPRRWSASSPPARAPSSTASSPTPQAASSTSPGSAGSPRPTWSSASRSATASAKSRLAPAMPHGATRTTASRGPTARPAARTCGHCAGNITA